GRKPVELLCRSSLEIPFAARLLQQPYACDLDVVRKRFAHVIDRERCNARTRQRFHLDTGAVMDRHLAADDDLAAALVLDFHLAVVESQGMTEGNELVRTLR